MVAGWVWGVVAMPETVLQVAGALQVLVRAFDPGIKKKSEICLDKPGAPCGKACMEHPLILGHIFQLAINRYDKRVLFDGSCICRTTPIEGLSTGRG